MAGLACAQALQSEHVQLTVFDKGRRPGGRVATRQTGTYIFDHGTPWLPELFGFPGQPWNGQLWNGHWVGVPSMQALVPRPESTTLHQGRHVAFLHADGFGWSVRHRESRVTDPSLVSDTDGVMDGPYDAVVLAIPAPQAAKLLSGIGLDAVARSVSQAIMTPAWTVMAGWDVRGSGIVGTHHMPLERVYLDSARPGRSAAPECWTAHATADWSQAHLYERPQTVLETMLKALAPTIQRTLRPDHAAVQRWRYARTGKPLGQPCLDTGRGLVVCGDWCLGPDVSDAIASGLAAALAIL